MNTPHDFSLQSTEAHAALDVVADAEVRAKAPGKTGFAAVFAVLVGLGVTVTIMNLLPWMLGVMAAIVVYYIVWIFCRPGVRDSARQPVDTSTSRERSRWSAFFPVLAISVANVLPPLWWLAVPAGLVVAPLTWRVVMKYQDVYFR